MNKTYTQITNQLKKKTCLLAVLIDPDKINTSTIIAATKVADFFLVGGSVVKNGELKKCITQIKKHTPLPIIIFPGDTNQLDNRADALLLLSLISGRNPDYLIGKHVEVARKIKKSKQETIPTGYILVAGGKTSSTQKASKTKPIKSTDIKTIVDTAIAGELLGMKLIYLEAGSGAKQQVKENLIKQVKSHISVPLLVGGGIDSKEKVDLAKKAGADIIVIGNALEKNISLLNDIKNCFK